MTLLEKQMKFAQMYAHLILQAPLLGYQVTLGDSYRDPRAPYGSPTSLHADRLAGDLNLFKNGIYLRKSLDHEPLGSWWESIGGTWGGRFMGYNERGELIPKPDGNHYSLEHEGRK